MGACISKCRPSRRSTHKHKEESLLVQDKLVISQASATPDIPLPNKQSTSLLSSPSDSCTSNITSTTTCSTSTLSSLSSTCSSLSLVSKDGSVDTGFWPPRTAAVPTGSFSNEFLWTHLKENPQLIPHGLDDAPKFPTQKLDSSSKSAVQPSQAAGRNGVPQQKRGRDRSPNLARQKSSRKEVERTQSSISSLPRRNLGSPSPSGSFNGDPCRGIRINSPKRCNSVRRSCDRDVGLKNNAVKSISSSAMKENLQHRNLLNKVSRDGSQLVSKRETCTHHIQDGIDQNSVEAMVYNRDNNPLPIDDINNPLISLDCFIFL
ncbi:hypothetical protein NE237_030439 [Protea cynaroides]|uniref:Uncharacterized protein n=1 Tax=Protea cynaroides TaxID=273540 RepID=A0A9Q0GX82_9MAGN|nr:hypothetical protein NE237_030439 [Protea cynaroides]